MLLVDPEYQDHGVIYLRRSNFQPAGVTVRLYAIRVFRSEIPISVYLSTKVCRTAHSLDPRRILIPPLEPAMEPGSGEGDETPPQH